MVILICLLSLFLCFPSQAAATSSNASRGDSILPGEKLDERVLPDRDLDEDDEYTSFLSDFYLEKIVQFLDPDLLLEGDLDDEDFYESDFDDDISLLSIRDLTPSLKNTVTYFGTINGTQYELVFSFATDEQLIVDDNGYLVNVGNSVATGRLLTNGFQQSDYNVRLYNLPTIFGNSSTQTYNNNTPNYMRYYYRSGNSMSYTDTYANFKVTKVVRGFSKSSNYLQYYILIVILFLGGMQLLCFMKKSQH